MMSKKNINLNEKESEKKAESSKEESKKSEEDLEKTREKKESIIKNPIICGKNLPISKKHGLAICKFISKKKIEEAIRDLEKVIRLKTPIPMRGEIPHKKGKGIMSARYPIKASRIVIKLLKGLNANAFVKNIEIENYRIAAKTDPAPRPYKRFGQKKMKRAHIIIKLIELKNKMGDIKKNEKRKKN